MGNLVLIVDEDQLERRYISALLAADGFDVIQVERAVEGLVAMTLVDPSLIILAAGPRLGSDASRVRIPQLVRVFRRMSDAPLAIIGDPEPTDEVESLESGGDLFLPRGFGASELISRSRMLVRRQRDPPRAAQAHSDAADSSAISFAKTAQSVLEVLVRRGAPNGGRAA